MEKGPKGGLKHSVGWLTQNPSSLLVTCFPELESNQIPLPIPLPIPLTMLAYDLIYTHHTKSPTFRMQK